MRMVSIMEARTKRVNWPVLASARVVTGITRWRTWSVRSPLPTVLMPLAGSQCRRTANTRIITRASQKIGTEMPAKANRLTMLSMMPPGRSAAATPSRNANTTESTNAASISLQVCSSAGTSTCITGCAWVREKPKSPCSAATSQCQ